MIKYVKINFAKNIVIESPRETLRKRDINNNKFLDIPIYRCYYLK